MVTAITQDQWQAARTSVRECGERFAEMVACAPDPHAMATADWTVADTAAHVRVIASMYASLLAGDDAPPPPPELVEQTPLTSVATVEHWNELGLRLTEQRDPKVITEQLRADIDLMLRSSEGEDPARPIDWLGGSHVPAAGVLAHLTNELLIHGRDIARALGTRWDIPAKDAAQFFELFLVGVTTYGYGRLLENDEPPRDRRIAVQFRSDHTTPATMVLHKGLVTIEEPRDDNDVRLFFQPPALNLMLFGRISRVRAALTRGVVVSGRRPWLLPRFMRTVRLPS